jgi:hypothetical protein
MQPTPRNDELSQRARVAAPPEPKCCWRNAWRAWGSVAPMSETFYVEGYVIDPSIGIAIEHGWLEVGGQAVDPTLPNQGGVTYTYYPGLRFTVEQALELLTSRHGPYGRKSRRDYTLPLFVRLSPADAGFNMMYDAMRSAYGAVFGEAYCARMFDDKPHHLLRIEEPTT